MMKTHIPDKIIFNRKADHMRFLRSIMIIVFCYIPYTASQGQVDFVQPAQGGKTFGVAGLTHDFTVRDWANYHNSQCFSTDGRYIVYTRYASDGRRFGNPEAMEIHLFDLYTAKDKLIDKGSSPRWANWHNWLFYVRRTRSAESEIWRYDPERNKKELVGTGMNSPGGVSYNDEYLMGGIRNSESTGPRSRSARMRIGKNSVAEYLPGLDTGSQWITNPRHDAVFARVINRDDQPFVATRYWYDINGDNIRIGSISLTRCHQAWSGDGSFFMLGNTQMRGRKWDEPFPSSLHFLAAIGTGDVSPCGHSGRFIVGDKPLTFADLRSGDGWHFLHDLSIIAYPDNISDASGPYDADMKGSPDGTKVAFVSNYDLINGPVTFITEDGGLDGTTLKVESTDMFPGSGQIVVRREVIGYSSKTANSFDGLTRRLYHTLGSSLQQGHPVTSFEARTFSDKEWKNLPEPAEFIQSTIGDRDSPLMRQNSTNLWAAIVRLPDRPWLRRRDNVLELVPGENHWETYGYYIYLNGKRITDKPVRPGKRLILKTPGVYSAEAVEWSWISSPKSNEINIDGKMALNLLHAQPAGFSWTKDVWLAGGEEIPADEAPATSNAVKQIVHRYDGVIAEEWYNWGEIKKRHDLNSDGKAIRRLVYHGHLCRREYHNSKGQHLSTEFLDEKGYVTEMIRYRNVNSKDGKSEATTPKFPGEAEGNKVEFDHWWYEDGFPVRRIGRQPARRINSSTPVMYVRAGDQWVKMDNVGKKPIQNENVSRGFSIDQQRALEFQKRSQQNR
ncbi:hypothetical protein BVY01_01085 [bacterium I07]|nr:hypothetical protein BVY01_01085 [bacterium I07]